MPSREEKQWQHHHANKAMRKTRKQIKRNRKPKRVRHKNWTHYDFDDPEAFEDFDSPQSERIMPRGEQERRRVNLAMVQAENEQVDSADDVTSTASPQGQPGIVVEVSSSLYRVELDGRSLLCSVRGSLSAEETGFANVVAVGDEVVVSEDGAEQGVVEAVLPRRGLLARPDVHNPYVQQVVAANVTQLLIVASWREPHIWLELVDRYLITARRNDLSPIICVNKIDLADDVSACRETLRPYLDLGYRVLFTSALTGKGVGRLRRALRGQPTVLAGLSGVGKSSLLAAVQPNLQLKVGEVSESSGQGQHTTAQVTLYWLDCGAFVVDAPGIREFGLSGVKQSDLAGYYPDIIAQAGDCRFANCTHIHEPDCAVKLAVSQGRLSPDRYHNYQKIYHSLPA